MEMVQLRYFRTVAQTNKMSDAAKILGVSHATISISISNLERDLGVRLFDRTATSVTLNEAGKYYLQRVDHIFELLDEAENVLRGGGHLSL